MSNAPSLPTEAPIVLKYPVNLPFTGAVMSLDGTDLKNPYKTPMWVDEVRIQQRPQDPNPLQNGTFSSNPAGASISIRLSLNGKLMFDDFVPLNVLSNLADPYVVIGTPALLLRLPKPMWLDENDQLSAELKWQNLAPPFNYWQTNLGTANNTVALDFLVFGRLTENSKRPKVRHLPFACSWTQEQPFVTGDEDFTRYRSPDSALYNGRLSNVHITRAHGVQLASQVPFLVPEMRLQISDSNGGYICKDPTPVYELFGLFSSWLDQSFIFKPGDFWTVEVELTDGDVLRPAQALDGLMIQMGLTGYQTETLPPL